MTLVNTETGELVDPLDVGEARRLTDRIRLIAETLADGLDKLADLIDQARTGSAWLALGYRSWTEYVATEFTGVLPRLEREPRQEFVRELASRGMSTRAIAPVVGASFKTVARDAAPVSGDTPAVTGLDGKSYQRPALVDHAALADRAVDEFPELVYYRDRGDRGDLEHTWRLAEKLREYDPDEQPVRRSTLRRSIEIDTCKRAGIPVPPLTHDHHGNPITPAPTPVVETCPACGQIVRN